MRKAYDKWLKSCLVRYNKKFNENRKYTSNDGTRDHNEVVEFDEDGHAYTFTPSDGVKEHGKVGTAWLASKYYLELVD